MKLSKVILAVAAILMSASGAFAQEALYAVGPFNGWDAKQPLSFDKDGDIFSITIDFSSSTSFKMSTVSGAGAAGNGWTEFDSGALKPVSTPALDEWVGLAADYKGNIEAPAKAELRVEVSLERMEMRFVKAPALTYSGTLPVMFINTAGAAPITSKETYLAGSYWLDPCGTEGVEALGSADEPLPLQIRGRGNYTWTAFDKKPYRLKLGEKAALAGLDKSKHFVLLAHADDRVGFMRNTLGFAASSMIGLTWTPQQRAVEVVLNGDYIGLYFLTENIRVDKNRVNVTEQEDGATTDVDGGWLVEIDNYDSDPHITVYEGTYPIWFTYKSPEVLSAEQEAFLQTQMQSIQNAIAANDYDTFSSLVDVDALARFYIVREALNDFESFHGSCYLWRQRGDEQKWHFGPVWDFGNALGSGGNNWIYISNFHQVWIGSVVQNFPQFNDRVKAIWTDFLSAGAQENLIELGRAEAQRISAAAAVNYRRWPHYGNSNEMESADVAFERLESKMNWLRSKWGEPSGIVEASADTQEAERVYVCDGALRIHSTEAATITIVTLQGRAIAVPVVPGLNSIPLPPGIYIVKR